MIGATWIMSVASIVYGALKLCRSGISQEVRRVIMARHVISILFYTIVELYATVSGFYILNAEDKTAVSIDAFWVDTMKILWLCQGLILPVTRLAEPFFYRIVMQKFRAI